MSLISRIERAYDNMTENEIKFSRLNLNKHEFVSFALAIRSVGLPNIRENYKNNFELDDVDYDILQDIVAVRAGREMFMAFGKPQKYRDNIALIVECARE